MSPGFHTCATSWRLLAVLLLGCCLPASGHEGDRDGPEVAGCSAPVRPSDKVDAARWNAFVDAVDAYRSCINSVVEANYAAADRHRLAAESAANAWNRFVRSSLNAPEDFPHHSRR